MVHQCCQRREFVRDVTYQESCVGRCKSSEIGSDELISGYSDAGWDSTFYPKGRECPGFKEA